MKIRKCYICGEPLFNKRGMYCSGCLCNRKKESTNISRKNKLLEDETKEKKIEFFLKAIKDTEKSLEIRKEAYIQELRSLGHNYQQEQRRLI